MELSRSIFPCVASGADREVSYCLISLKALDQNCIFIETVPAAQLKEACIGSLSPGSYGSGKTSKPVPGVAVMLI